MDVSTPKISICLPVLNAGKYLNERWQSIRDQSYRDWELIVCDSHSDDGSWEFLQDLAATDKRVSLHRVAREGIYEGINECVRRVSGEFIYIATADDTMLPDCLEKMVAALEENSECGFCQCSLEIIDEKGDLLHEDMQWHNYTFGKYNYELITRKNIRYAPYDGILYPGLLTIYTSLTQLLVRKTVFEKCGLFEGTWGAISDYEWGMRIGLLENCIFVPEKLATWRIHKNQATDHHDSFDRRLKILQMTYSAINKSSVITKNKINKSWIKPLGYIIERDLIQISINNWVEKKTEIKSVIKTIKKHPGAFAGHIKDIFLKKYWGQWHHGNRYKMINHLLQKYVITYPKFLN